MWAGRREDGAGICTLHTRRYSCSKAAKPPSPLPQHAQPPFQGPLVVVPRRVRLWVTLDAVHAQGELLLVHAPQQRVPVRFLRRRLAAAPLAYLVGLLLLLFLLFFPLSASAISYSTQLFGRAGLQAWRSSSTSWGGERQRTTERGTEKGVTFAGL